MNIIIRSSVGVCLTVILGRLLYHFFPAKALGWSGFWGTVYCNFDVWKVLILSVIWNLCSTARLVSSSAIAERGILGSVRVSDELISNVNHSEFLSKIPEFGGLQFNTPMPRKARKAIGLTSDLSLMVMLDYRPMGTMRVKEQREYLCLRTHLRNISFVTD